MLLDKAYQIYCKSISDETKIGGKPWKERKQEVLGSDNYKESEWFKELTDFELGTLESLREKQMQLGGDKSLDKTLDPKKV